MKINRSLFFDHHQQLIFRPRDHIVRLHLKNRHYVNAGRRFWLVDVQSSSHLHESRSQLFARNQLDISHHHKISLGVASSDISANVDRIHNLVGHPER